MWSLRIICSNSLFNNLLHLLKAGHFVMQVKFIFYNANTLIPQSIVGIYFELKEG
jgi:hypothetical protein